MYICSMDLFTTTATNLFIRPLFNIPTKTLSEFEFENAYIEDKLREVKHEDSIYLLFRPIKYDKFNEFVERENKKGTLVDEYDYPNGWVMLVFKYDKKWRKDIELIKKGKFSKVSREYKLQIPETTGVIGKSLKSMQHHVFEKTDYVKKIWYDKYGLEFEPEDECWHYYPEREIFTEETLNKLV